MRPAVQASGEAPHAIGMRTSVAVGVDLAWSARNPSGVAALEPSGRLVSSSVLLPDEEIERFIAARGGDDCVVAFDAPLIVSNPSGRRTCEALIHRAYGRYDAGPYPSHLGNPLFAPPRAFEIAHRLGLETDPAPRAPAARRRAIEVYPHPAMVSIFGLERVIPYKQKQGRPLEQLRAAHLVLLASIEQHCGALLGLADSPRWSALRSVVESATRKSELKRVEDEIDAIFCAYLAWCWIHGRQDLVVFGDAQDGYIIAPVPPESPR